MKNIAILFIALLPILACNNGKNDDSEKESGTEMHEEQEHNEENGINEEASLPSTGHFGAEITPDGAIPAEKVVEILEGKDSAEVKVIGIAKEVCQAKGCWMTMPAGDRQMRISFKDYGFFVPKDASGKEVIMKGVVKKEIVPVEELRHYAQDAGKSEEEILAITEPEENIVFIADGVIIREPGQ